MDGKQPRWIAGFGEDFPEVSSYYLQTVVPTPANALILYSREEIN
jgi:hypothetical protein